MTALLDADDIRPAAPAQSPDALSNALYGRTAPVSQGELANYSTTGDALKSMMPDLVKGAGLATKGGNTPLTDPTDITLRAHQATVDLRTEINRGLTRRSDVVKSLNPGFLGQFGALRTALSTPSVGEQIAEIFGQMNPDLVRSFTAGNLGIGSVSGLVPFNLLAPSRLVYPVYTVYRNKFPRPAGQGASLIERLFTGISGSQTGNQSVTDISLSELVQSNGTFSNWPLNLPGAGSQTEVQINIPYKFMGITEQLSWLAQFAGQGFEDISALASLIMLQQMMLGEEYQMIAGSSATLAAPATPTVTARTAGSNETTVGANTNYSVYVTATNYFGETTISGNGAVSGGTSAGQVVDVTIVPVTGAMNYNIYVSTNGSPSRTNAWLAASGVGGVKYTLQGTPPSSGTNPPSADSGTGKSTRIEGVIPVLSGMSANAGVYPTSPTQWIGGYYNNAVGTHLSYNAIYNALKALWQPVNGSINPGGFRADPAELISSGIDIANLSTDVISQGAATNYQLLINQNQTGDVTVGAAVSQFQNPLTRSMLKLVVHPWYTQGNATLLSYQLPQTWTNVANAWEMSMVQDYVSVSWPVIDATFRYSIFAFGALVCHAPWYSAHLSGLQNQDSTPYS
jgi:hypothetical protein